MLTVGCSGTAGKRNRQWSKNFTYLPVIEENLAKGAQLNLMTPCPDDYKKKPDAPKKQKTSETSDMGQRLTWVEQAQCYMRDEHNTAVQKAELRNWIIENFVTMANHAYGDFEHDSTVVRNTTSVAFDFINLGFTAGTAIFTAEAKTLGAVGTLTQGLQHSVDKNYYNSVTTFVINNKMEALRLDQLSKIREREALPVQCSADDYKAQGSEDKSKNGSQLQCYSLAQAMNDVQEYYYAGSIHRALQSINTQSAEQATNAETKLKTSNTQPIK